MQNVDRKAEGIFVRSDCGEYMILLHLSMVYIDSAETSWLDTHKVFLVLSFEEVKDHA